MKAPVELGRVLITDALRGTLPIEQLVGVLLRHMGGDGGEAGGIARDGESFRSVFIVEGMRVAVMTDAARALTTVQLANGAGE
jgi:hypothetical protein